MSSGTIADEGDLVAGARAGDRRSLSRLLSLIERGGEPGLAASLHDHGRRAIPYTVGLTGAPGAGKSTLTDALVSVVREAGDRCAVIAVDPSSPVTNGAILGDRVRLRGEHARDDDVFVRSFANRCRLGGLTGALPNAIAAFAVAGWPTVLLETVGVGQAEVDVAVWTDTTVVVVNPGWGDEIQANKSGLLEIADVLVVNKADRKGLGAAEADLERMLDFSDPRDWRPPIVATVATEGRGVAEAWAAVGTHRRYLEASGELARRRRRRVVHEVREEVADAIARDVAAAEGSARGRAILESVVAGEVAPTEAAETLLHLARTIDR